jgi:glycosyltransferase involved in cell wall biosynthesis
MLGASQPGSPEAAPLVSIIIPCWNAAVYVGKAIESALGQTYPNIEVIVIDEGSTDGSLEVICSFGDRIQWETGPNEGGCATRNRGVELARGALIQFLDADDLLYPDKLSRMVPLAIEHGPGFIPICDWIVEFEDKARAPMRDYLNYDGQDPVVFCLRSPPSIGSALHWKRDLGDVGGFRIGLRASQEFDLYLRLATNGKGFVYLPEPLYKVRRRANSLSSDAGRTFAMKMHYLPEILSDLEQRNLLTAPRTIEFARYSARIGRMCLRHGQREAGLALLRMAAELDRSAADRAAYGLLARFAKKAMGPAAVEAIGSLRRVLKKELFRGNGAG